MWVQGYHYFAGDMPGYFCQQKYSHIRNMTPVTHAVLKITLKYDTSCVVTCVSRFDLSEFFPYEIMY